MKNSDPCNQSQADPGPKTIWFLKGYQEGCQFAREEADFADLAAIRRAGRIPTSWDLFLAELMQKHFEEKGFDFQQYVAGFAKACIEFFDAI